MPYNKSKYRRYGANKRHKAIVFFGPNGSPPKKYNFDSVSSFDRFLSKDHPKYYYYNLYNAATGKFIVKSWNPVQHWKRDEYRSGYNKSNANGWQTRQTYTERSEDFTDSFYSAPSKFNSKKVNW